MKRIYRARNLPEAHILLHLLDQAGVPARVFNENLNGALGEIPFIEAEPEVWVERELDLERARRVLREFQSAPGDEGARICARCGEENPHNFQVCWCCGAGMEIV